MVTLPLDNSQLTYGFDISAWEENPDKPKQTSINFQKAYDTGYSFVYSKASDGISGYNPWYPYQRDAAMKVGLLFGAFHWFRNKQDPAKQLKNFLSKIGNNIELLPPWVDVEETGDCDDPPTTRKNLGGMMWELRKAIRQEPWYYSAVWFWDRYVSLRPFELADSTQVALYKTLLGYKQVMAAYPDDLNGRCFTDICRLVPGRKVLPFGGFGSIIGWQFTSHGTIPGLENHSVDVDVILAPLSTMQSWVSGGTVQPPSVVVPPTVYARYTVNGPQGGANVRQDPSTMYKALRWLPNGTSVVGYKEENNWVKISDVKEEWVYKPLLAPEYKIALPLITR